MGIRQSLAQQSFTAILTISIKMGDFSMQVLLRKSTNPANPNEKQDVQCSVCNQGFRIYWERTSDSERAAMRVIVLSELSAHHSNDATTAAHPSSLFNVPNWQGPAQFSGAAMLGGLSTIRRAAPAELDFTSKRVG
jgi:hypothetical protein